MKPLKYNEENNIYIIVDQYNNIIKPLTTGTYLFMNKKARDKQLGSEWFVNYCKKNGIIAIPKTMILKEKQEM
ncbi:hypothetical protein [uncultured Eubacterium sp.]|uniref:hypothetical protein n=1 Tax=uncultured Eubacterium sp. TaxID=165185 RepID=UPI0025968747|nr:hypothetical protein [uncultured Eubacterium sp.]